MENWKPIPGYEGIYEASNLGRIRTAPGKTTSNARFQTRVWKSRILKPKHSISSRREDGHVSLWKGGKNKDYLVARLVAAAWVGEPKDGMTVNHINGDYRDNRPENLEWVSNAANIRHGFATGLYAALQKRVKLIDENGQEKSFPSMAEAGIAIGRHSGYISNLLKRGTRYATSIDGAKYSVMPF